MQHEDVLFLMQEARRNITEPVDNLAFTAEVLTLTPVQAAALVDETAYELDPGPSPTTVAGIRAEIAAGVYIPAPEVALAIVGTQRRCVVGRAFLEAVAGLAEGAYRCVFKEYRCERWAQVSSLYWSCILTSLAP
jgi:hypothetical protein